MPLDITSHRHAIGKYNATEKAPSKKAIIRAFKKARNSYESPRSQRTHPKATNKSNTAMTVVKIALVAGIVAATIPSAGATINGISRENNANAKNTFPFIKNHVHGDRASKHNTCSSTRISSNQILTAAHCIKTEKSTTKAQRAPNAWINANRRIKRGDTDISIMTFPQNLAGNTFCVPVMSNTTYQMLLDSPNDICGLNGRLIMLGYGISERTGTARAAVFEPMTTNLRIKPSATRAHKSSTTFGVPPAEGQFVNPGEGDSGAGVLGCNPATGKYELIGVHVQSSKVKYSPFPNADVRLGVFVNLVEHQELSTWVLANRASCTGPNIDPNDIYDTRIRNNGEKHELDRCKLPTKYYYHVGMSKEEIAGCYEKNKDSRASVDCFHIKSDSSASGEYHYKARNTCDTGYTLNLYDNNGADLLVDIPANSVTTFGVADGPLKTDGDLYWGLNSQEPHSFRVRDFFEKKMVFPDLDIPKSSPPKPSRELMGEAECLYLTLKPDNRLDVGNWCAAWNSVAFKVEFKDGRGSLQFRDIIYSQPIFNMPIDREINTEAGLWFSRTSPSFSYKHIPNYFKEPPPRDLRGLASCVNINETKTRSATTNLVKTQGHIKNHCDQDVVVNFQETNASNLVSTIRVKAKKEVSFPVSGEIDRNKGIRVNFVGEQAFTDFSHHLAQYPAPADPPSNCFHIKELTPNGDQYIYKARNTCDRQYTLKLYDKDGVDSLLNIPAQSVEEFSIANEPLKTDGNLYWGLDSQAANFFVVPDFFNQKMVFPESDIVKSAKPKPSREHMGEAECLYLTIKPQNKRLIIQNWCAIWPRVSFVYQRPDGEQVRLRDMEYRNKYSHTYDGINQEVGLWFSKDNSLTDFKYFPTYFKEDFRGPAFCVNINETKTRNKATDLVETQGHIKNGCDQDVVVNFQETGASGLVSTVAVKAKKEVTFPVSGEIDRSKGTRVNFVGEYASIDFSHYLDQHPAPADPPSHAANA